MSTTIDSKVVEMRFDNQQFESGINQSISSIDRLKSALSFGGVKSAVGTITTSMNAFGVVAKRVLENLTDSAVATGARLVKSLSLDQITEGWGKYENITKATQTIMAATKTTWIQGTDEFKKYAAEVDKYNKNVKNMKNPDTGMTMTGKGKTKDKKTGKIVTTYEKEAAWSWDKLDEQKKKLVELTKTQAAQMEYVNKQLGKLNWYTDETSYNLVDMTSNIGKFTSAGIGLEDATNAMMGIASWAAISGANTQQASRAMYNLSQAMGMGELRIQDWMSIENANMATLEFKNTAIQTAYSMGKLKKDATGALYAIDQKGNKVIVTAENFRSTLSAKWFDKSVITATLKVYGDFANDLYKYTQETGLTTTQLLKYTKQVKQGILDVNNVKQMSNLADELGLSREQLDSLTDGLKEMSKATKDLGFRAMVAGQEAKTFSEAINYVKDAVSTGWMRTFQIIFGDYLKSTELWTEVAEEFYDLFVYDVEKQNDVLKEWANMGGREQILWGIKKLWKGIKAVISTIKETIQDVFPPATGEYLYKISSKFNLAMSSMEKSVKPLTLWIKYTLLPVFRGFKNIIESIVEVGKALKRAFSNIFKLSDISVIQDAANLFEKLTKSFKITEERGKKLEKFFTGLFAVADILKMAIQELLKALFDLDGKEGNIADGALDVAANFGDWLKSVRDWIKESGVFKNYAKWIANFLKDLPGKINRIWQSLTGMDFKEWCDKLVKEDLPNLASWISEHLPGITKTVDNTGKAVEKVSGGIGKVIEYGRDLGMTSGVIDEVNKSLQGLAQYLKQVGENAQKNFKPPQSAEEWSKFFKNVKNWIKVIFYFLLALKAWEKLQKITKPIKDIKQGISDLLQTWKFNMNLGAVLKIVDALKSITAMIVVLSLLPTDKLIRSTAILGGFLIAIGAFFLILANLKVDPKKLDSIATLMKSISLTLMAILASFMVIAVMAERDMWSTIAAAGVMVVMFAAIALVVNKLSKIQFDNSQLLGLSVSMFLMAAAISSIGGAIMLTTQSKDWKAITAAGAALAGVLLSMALTLKIMPKNNDIANAAGSLVVVGASLLLVAGALALVASIGDPAKLLLGAAALGIMMGAIATSIFLLSKAGNGAEIMSMAGALLIASAGIIALAVALRLVSDVVASGNAVGAILLLTGALAALVIAALLCSNPAVQAALYAIGAACALIGVGALAAGAGLVLFAGAVERLAKVGPKGVTLLVQAIKEFALIMPDIATKVAEAIVALLDSFVKSRDKVVQALAGIITIIFDVLIQSMPKLFEFLGNLITNICTLLIEKAPIIAQAIIVVTKNVLLTLREIIPDITKTLFTILVDTLTQIKDNIEEIVKLSVEIGILTITGFVKGITEQIPNLVETGWGLIIAIINGISEGIDLHAKELKKAIDKLANAIIDGFCTIMGIKSPSKVFDGFGTNIVQGLINGITGMAKDAWDAISGLAKDLIDNFKNGFKDIVDKAGEIMGDVVGKIEGFKDKMKEIGSNIVNALKKGMEEAKKKITDAAGAVAGAITDTVKKIFKIKSPSRVFMEIGKYLDEGLAIGMDNYAYKAVDATEDVSDSIIKTIANLSDMINSEIDAEPTIKPVLDLSDVSNGVDQMNSMFSANRSINLASSNSSISSTISAQQQTNAMLNTLRSTLSNLGSDGGTVNNNTFNITGDDPKAIADEVSRILNNKVERRDAAWAL